MLELYRIVKFIATAFNILLCVLGIKQLIHYALINVVYATMQISYIRFTILQEINISSLTRFVVLVVSNIAVKNVK